MLRINILTLLTLLFAAVAVTAQRCPKPTINSYDKTYFTTQQFEIAGEGPFTTTRSDCTTLRVFRRPTPGGTLTLLGTGTADAATGNFAYTHSGTAVPDGQIELVVRYGVGGVQSEPSEPFYITIAAVPCNTPVFTSPADGSSIPDRSPQFIGTKGTQQECDTLTYTFVSGLASSTPYPFNGQYSNEFSLYNYERNLAAGQYEVEIISSSQFDRRPSSVAGRTRFTVVSTPCPAPLFNNLVDGQVFAYPNSPNPVEGTMSRLDCERIDTYVNGGQGTTFAYDYNNDGVAEWSTTFPRDPGTYEVEAYASTGSGLDPGSGTLLTYTITPASCAVPVILLPTENQRVRTLTPTISGTQEDFANCPSVRIEYQEFNRAVYGEAPVNSDGSWSFTIPEIPNNYDYQYVRAAAQSSDNQLASDYSAYRFFFVQPRCVQPGYYSPSDGAEIVGSTLEIRIYGNNDPDCTKVTLYRDEETPFATGTLSTDGTTEVTIVKTGLAPGEYRISAVLGEGDLLSDRASRTFYLVEQGPSVRITIAIRSLY